jgi:hypothetical protein
MSISPDYAVAEFAEDARRRVRRRTFGTSIARQQSRFRDIGNPLRLQMPKKHIKNQFHLLGERFKYICKVSYDQY